METAIINELKAGNSESFCNLVMANKKTVFNVCYRFLMNKEDAEDVSQEVFIEVYHSINKFKGESKLSTWLYRIAVTKSLDEIKKQRRKKRISSAGKILDLEHAAVRVAGKERPDKTLEEKENYSLLMKTMDKLPENQRIAFSLSKVDGFSNPEIAIMMGTTLTAVDSLIYRARQNLKMFLEKQTTRLSSKKIRTPDYSQEIQNNKAQAA